MKLPAIRSRFDQAGRLIYSIRFPGRDWQPCAGWWGELQVRKRLANRVDTPADVLAEIMKRNAAGNLAGKVDGCQTNN